MQVVLKVVPVNKHNSSYLGAHSLMKSIANVGLASMLLSTAVQAQLSGQVQIDGSSTVAPIMQAAAELFLAENPRVKVPVGISGTGGGFKKFLDEKTDLRPDIQDASRPIKPTEIENAKSVGMEFIEIPIAIDGISVVVHPTNSFCDHLTVEELKRIWEPGSKITNWKDIRPGFPDLALKLYGPGADSGTFDFFTEVICGKEKAARGDFTASENDNALVQGVAGDKGSLGYFGFAYYEANHNKLKLLGVDSGRGKPVKPSLEIIRAGEYHPLSRPLLLYVGKASYARPEVKAFLAFLLGNARKIVEHPKVGYVALPLELYDIAQKRLDKGVTGTAFAGGDWKTKSLTELFRAP